MHTSAEKKHFEFEFIWILCLSLCSVINTTIFLPALVWLWNPKECPLILFLGKVLYLVTRDEKNRFLTQSLYTSILSYSWKLCKIIALKAFPKNEYKGKKKSSFHKNGHWTNIGGGEGKKMATRKSNTIPNEKKTIQNRHGIS